MDDECPPLAFQLEQPDSDLNLYKIKWVIKYPTNTYMTLWHLTVFSPLCHFPQKNVLIIKYKFVEGVCITFFLLGLIFATLLYIKQKLCIKDDYQEDFKLYGLTGTICAKTLVIIYITFCNVKSVTIRWQWKSNWNLPEQTATAKRTLTILSRLAFIWTEIPDFSLVQTHCNKSWCHSNIVNII